MSESPRPEHVPQFDALAHHLREASDGANLVFCPSPGNWGDSIINAGTRHFLDFYHLNYVELRRERLLRWPAVSSCHVLVGGGGGWCEYWHTTPEYVERISPIAKSVTVLPTTFGSIPWDFRLPKNTTLFARDASYSLAQQEQATFCHDMAFHYSPLAIRPGGGFRRLLALRTDKESARPDATQLDVADNHDVSLRGDGYTDPSGLYAFLARYDSIETDRLHLGIASAQMGLTVTLFPNAYPKIHSIYASSLEGIFSNVTLGAWKN